MPARISPKSAIYLFGHGPRRQPRLVELQHRIIVRARGWLTEKWGRFEFGEVFVDLNFPRDDFRSPMPAMDRLVDEIQRKIYSHVALNIESGSFPNEEHHWIADRFEAAGAVVCNLAYEDGPTVRHIAESLRRCELPESDAARIAQMVGDDDEFLAMFPALSAAVLQEAVAAWPRADGQPWLQEVRSIVQHLQDKNPYSSEFVPWGFGSRAKGVWDQLRHEQEEKRQQRRSSELLYRLGPNHAGFLADERADVDALRHTQQDLSWAEKRLCEELEFSKTTEGRFISFQRTIGDLLLYADPRVQGHIRVYAYRRSKTARPSAYLTTPVKVLDSWKHDVATKLVQRIEKLTPCQVGSF